MRHGPRTRSALAAALTATLETLFPPTCIACRRLLRAGADRDLPLCSGCRIEHVPLPPERRREHGVEALYAHEGPLRTALTAFKFSGALELAGPLARLYAPARTLRTGPPWDVIVPVPLHFLRALGRGFNQCALLADGLRAELVRRDRNGGRRRPVPSVDHRALRRIRATRAQTRQGADARRRNVVGAFAVRSRRLEVVRGRSVLVLDDVTTTGATLRACMDALRAAGARRVGGLALLRAV